MIKPNGGHGKRERPAPRTQKRGRVHNLDPAAPFLRQNRWHQHPRVHPCSRSRQRQHQPQLTLISARACASASISTHTNTSGSA